METIFDKWRKRYELFCFDFDGLLVDTEPLHHQAYLDALAHFGFEMDWDLPIYLSMAMVSRDALMNAAVKRYPEMLTHVPWDVIYKKKHELYLQSLQQDKLILMPGADALLNYIDEKNLLSCIVTNSPNKQVMTIIDQLSSLKKIPHVITREDYVEAKPAPDGYLAALDKLGVASDKAIGFEDSIKGLDSLKRAGITPVWVTAHRTIIDQSSNTDMISHFDSLSEITDAK